MLSQYVDGMGMPPRATGVEEKSIQKAELPLLLDTWSYPELMIVLQSSSTGKAKKLNKVTINMLYLASGKGSVNAGYVMS